VTCNDLYIESGAGLQWHLACMALQGWGWAMQLGFGFGSGRTRAPSSASHYKRFLALFLYFMTNAHSTPESIRWSIIRET
jgi:hypothetical protein